MKLKNLIFAFFAALCLGNSDAAPDSQGTEFLVAFGGNNPDNEKLVLFLSSSAGADVQVDLRYYENASYLNPTLTQVTVSPGQIQQVEISELMRLNNSGGVQIENKTIIVNSSDEVSLYGVNRAYFSGEAFLVLPTDVWGTTYFVFSTQDVAVDPDQNGVLNGSQFSVIAKDDTMLNITFSVKSDDLIVEYDGVIYGKNDVMSVTLLALETLHIAANVELTGVRIDSDVPVGVLSGHRRTGVEHTVGSDHLEEMIPPINTWSTEFIIPSVDYRKSYDVIKVVAAMDGLTTLNVTGASEHLINLTYAGDYVTLNLSSDNYFAIFSTQPVGIMQYCVSNDVDDAQSDPFMIWVTPIPQYSNQYVVATAEGVSDDFFQTLVLVYKEDDFYGLTINDVNITEDDCSLSSTAPHCLSVTNQVTAGFDGLYKYSVYNLNDDVGSYILKHADPTVTFAVFIYGQVKLEAYGYTGGSRFADLGGFCKLTNTVTNDGLDNDCDNLVDEELWNRLDDDGDGLVDEDLTGTLLISTTTAPTVTTTTATTTASTSQSATAVNANTGATINVNSAGQSTNQNAAGTTAANQNAGTTAGTNQNAAGTAATNQNVGGTTAANQNAGTTAAGSVTSNNAAPDGQATINAQSTSSNADGTTQSDLAAELARQKQNTDIAVGVSVPASLALIAVITAGCIKFVLAARKKKMQIEDEEQPEEGGGNSAGEGEENQTTESPESADSPQTEATEVADPGNDGPAC